MLCMIAANAAAGVPVQQLSGVVGMPAVQGIIIIIIIIIIINIYYYGGAITYYAAGPPYSVKSRNHKLADTTQQQVRW